MMEYLIQTKNDRLNLETDVAKWHVDAYSAVHPNMQSDTGISLTFG